jgi:predicted CXXCH cytochrome family protein
MLLIAAGSLWLFLAAVPALADGGPHVASANSGVSSLTADGCAGCHRAHTAQGPLLLIATSEEELCLSCHGSAGTGATTDVMTGVQYRIAVDGTRTGTVLGALRGGGFDQARIGDPFRYAIDNGSGGVSRKGKIQVASSGANVTSAHLGMAENGLDQPGILWGNGSNGSGAGPAVSIGCASCHNPHGNGAYRILNPIPSPSAGSTAWSSSVVDYGVAAANRYRTAASHGFLIGDTVTITDNSAGAGVNVTLGVVATVPSSNTFTLTGVTVAGTGIGGVATRVGGVKVIDAAAPPAGDERNYTVIQTSTTAGYTLLASQAAAFSPTAGDYFHYQVPWNAVTGSNLDAPNGIPGNTLGATGFGQQITVWCASCHSRYWAASEPTTNPPNGTVGPAYSTVRPGDAIYTYQHRTRGESGRSCVTCHVSHGTNAIMDGSFSSTLAMPNGTVDVGNSRLLKVGNRGTCQLCHDPTATIVIGDQFPLGAPVPSVP